MNWDKREWISIYKDGFNLFLLEENLVLAQRSTPPPKGNMHPALVRFLIEFIASKKSNSFFFQTFKPLVDTVGLFKSKFQPVEFLVDLRLDFQDYNKLRKIWVRPLSRFPPNHILQPNISLLFFNFSRSGTRRSSPTATRARPPRRPSTTGFSCRTASTSSTRPPPFYWARDCRSTGPRGPPSGSAPSPPSTKWRRM